MQAGKGVWESTSTGIRRVISRPAITEADLSSGVYQLNTEQLRAAWIARFGKGWVKGDAVAGDDYFMKVHNRLGALGEVEEAYVTDSIDVFIRIKQ